MRKLASIILAAGKGTRMKSSKPKVIFELAGKAMVNRVIETATEVGSTLINIVVGYKKNDVMEVVGLNDKVIYSEQKEQNGTGHAVIVTKNNLIDFDGDILILCGDVPLLKPETLKIMIDEHRQNNASCTVLTAMMDDALRYGRIVRNENDDVARIVEFKDASDEQKEIKEINTGIYCFNGADLFEALSKINNNNAQNEYYLTDTLEILNSMNKKVISAHLENMVEASGINSQKQLSELENLHYNEIRDFHMNNGVKIQNPTSVLIGDNVQIENDVVIGANVILTGNTLIEKNSNIGPFSYIEDSQIKSNSILKGYNRLVSAEIPAKTNLAINESIINE